MTAISTAFGCMTGITALLAYDAWRVPPYDGAPLLTLVCSAERHQATKMSGCRNCRRWWRRQCRWPGDSRWLSLPSSSRSAIARLAINLICVGPDERARLRPMRRVCRYDDKCCVCGGHRRAKFPTAAYFARQNRARHRGREYSPASAGGAHR